MLLDNLNNLTNEVGNSSKRLIRAFNRTITVSASFLHVCFINNIACLDYRGLCSTAASINWYVV